MEDLKGLLLLADWSDDPELTHWASSLLDVQFVELASHLQNGSFGATHGRTYLKDKMTGAGRGHLRDGEDDLRRHAHRLRARRQRGAGGHRPPLPAARGGPPDRDERRDRRGRAAPEPPDRPLHPDHRPPRPGLRALLRRPARLVGHGRAVRLAGRAAQHRPDQHVRPPRHRQLLGPRRAEVDHRHQHGPPTAGAGPAAGAGREPAPVLGREHLHVALAGRDALHRPGLAEGPAGGAGPHRAGHARPRRPRVHDPPGEGPAADR